MRTHQIPAGRPGTTRLSLEPWTHSLSALGGLGGRGWLTVGVLCGTLLLGCAGTAPPPPYPSATAPAAAAPPAPVARPSSATQVPALPPSPTPGSGTPSASAATPVATALPAASPPTPTALLVRRVLEVPMHRQEHALSCEAAALKMALGTLGKKVEEGALLAELARDPTPRRVLPDGRVEWGDPEVGFVGNWDGVFLQDGYGVYEGPIAELALRQGFRGTSWGKDGGTGRRGDGEKENAERGTTESRGTDPRELYGAVRQGFPSVVWIPYELRVKGRGFWATPAGKRIDYVVTEHAVVLAGVDGEGIYYADPMKPALQRASYAAFEAGWAELGRRAVTVRP